MPTSDDDQIETRVGADGHDPQDRSPTLTLPSSSPGPALAPASSPAPPTPTRPRVLIIGNLTLDDVVLPDGTTHMASTGGNSLYAALGARLWEPDIGLVTRRGEDFPRDLRAELVPLGIATEGITAIPGPTVRNWVVYEHSGARHWIYRTPRERSREVAVQPNDIPPAWLHGTDLSSTTPAPAPAPAPAPVVHIAAMPLDAAEALVAALRRQRPDVILTLDTHEDYVLAYRERLRALAAQVDAFIPSRDELADLVGYDDPPRALAELAAALPTPIIVVKMGADGALVWDRARAARSRLDAAPSEVVDVTGAGDAFCGGLAAGLALGCTAVEAAQRGAVSAAYAIAGFGSLRLADVTPAEAHARLLRKPPATHPLPVSRDSIATVNPPGEAPTDTTDATSATDAATGTTGTALEREENLVLGADRGIRSAADIMREEIAMVPRLFATQAASLAEPLRILARDLTRQGIEHLYLVGCGDSAFAGAATALTFRKHAGVEAEALHALELARYRVRYLPQRSAVICISFSGKVGRTIEAAMQAQRFGHTVIALTGNADSPLARQATSVLLLDVPTLGYSPGTSTYLALLAALSELAAAWGTERARDVQALRTGLDQVPALAAATLEVAEAPVRALAPRLAAHEWITFLGAGPNLATARFGAAKLFEGPQMLGTATNLEEWAHEDYFITRRGTPVLMIAPSGAAFSRAEEILSELLYLGADTVLISDVQPEQPQHGAPLTYVPLAAGLPEELTPMLGALPLSLLAYHITRARGQQRFEFTSAEVAREHYDTIHRATQGEPA